MTIKPYWLDWSKKKGETVDLGDVVHNKKIEIDSKNLLRWKVGWNTLNLFKAILLAAANKIREHTNTLPSANEDTVHKYISQYQVRKTP